MAIPIPTTTSPDRSHFETLMPEMKANGSGACSPTSSATIKEFTEDDKLEPIAVIGLSLRFPQDATSPESFWQMLLAGRSAMTDVPKERFNIDSFYRAGESRTGCVNAKGGHFVKEDIAAFDAPFFTMTPAEAECVDPMQRWLLETTYEALENAGVHMQDIAGSKTSVYVGAFLREYQFLLSRDPQMKQKHKASGTAFAMLANRLSWFFDLMGPSFALDTACSSSLYALHLACQSLRSGESTMGIVGGCNLFYNPDTMTELTDLNFLSPDSISYSFDHQANGYSRGEGFGVVILKTLTSALRDGDTIRSVIRATGANQDGKTPGITQPSSIAQQQLIRDTYAAGGLDMSVTRFFEAHGTGTAIGDPLEANAIHTAFGDVHSKDDPLYIGAVKSNIGHLEGAAGIAGLIKTILVLENATIPPNIWFERPNPKIPAEKWNLKFPLVPTPWPTDGLRRASVNSFGFGGSNSHAVLDDVYNHLKMRGLWGKHCTRERPPSKLELSSPLEIPEIVTPSTELGEGTVTNDGSPQLFVWSAAEEDGLKRISEAYARYLPSNTPTTTTADFFESLAYTLSEKRSRLSWSSYAVASSVGQLKHCLDTGLSSPIRLGRTPKLGYIFTGQGAQWHAMGRELLTYPVFKNNLENAELAFRRLSCPWSLMEELQRDVKTSRLSEPSLSQPVCTAVQIALIELLTSWKILPTTVIGHSSGEIAAAYCTGGLSRASALKVAYYRGVVADALKKSTKTAMSMLAVGLSEIDMQEYLQKRYLDTESVTIACINSTKSVTMSGASDIIDTLNQFLQSDGIFAQKLNVDIAYHSKYMNEVSATYEEFLGELPMGTPLASHPVMFSSVTGKIISAVELSHGSYWVRNLVSPVKFLQAVTNISVDTPKTLGAKRMGKGGVRVDHLVEIGPHSALQGPLKAILATTQKGKTIGYSSILVRQKHATVTALEVAGMLHSMGFPVDVATVNNRGQQIFPLTMLTNLPAYPFNHSKKYWLESRLSKNLRFRAYPHHELLGSRVPDWNPLCPRWRNLISLSDHPWVQEHKVNGLDVYPAAGMIVMAIEGARQLADPLKKIAGYRFKDVSISNAIVLRSKDATVEAELELRPGREKTAGFLSWAEFSLFTYENESIVEACSGSIALEYAVDSANEPSSHEIQFQDLKDEHKASSQRCSQSLSSDKLYEYFNQIGLNYGPAFQTLEDICFNQTGEATASINLQQWISKTSTADIQPHFIHPAALDAVLQLSIAALSNGTETTIPTMVPTKISELWLIQDTNSPNRKTAQQTDLLNVYAKSELRGSRTCHASITAMDANSGMPRIICSLEITGVAQSEDASTAQSENLPPLFHLEWKPDLDLVTNQEILTYCASLVDSSKYPPASAFKVPEKRLYCEIIIWKAYQALDPAAESTKDPTLSKYIEWMRYRLSEFKMDPDTTEARLQELSNTPNFMQTLEDTVEKSDAEGRLIVRVGRNLQDILHGKTNAMELLFHDEVLSDYYRHGNDAYSAFSKLKVYIGAMAHQKPDLKVLEIGAGTGSATMDLMETIVGEAGSPRFSEYVFTDISPKFFKEAKENLKDIAENMTFSVLDIGKDPIQQGFEEDKYDLIVASNVLHATPNLAQTLKNTHKLLKPQGKLVLYELIDPTRINLGFIFGLFSGWWLSTEENRCWCPLMPEKDWNNFLLQNEFSGIDLAFDEDDLENHTVAAMVSTAVKAPPSSTQPPGPQIHIVISEDQESQRVLAGQLESLLADANLGRSTVITLPDIDSVDLTEASCIFLADMEASILDEPSPKNFARIQRLVSSVKHLLWVSSESIAPESNPTHGMINGLRRVVSREVPALTFASLSIPSDSDSLHQADFIQRTFNKILKSNVKELDLEYRVQDNVLCLPRLVQTNCINKFIASKQSQQPSQPTPFKTGHDRALKLDFKTVGSLDGIQFIDDSSVAEPLGDTETEIAVEFSGLNFRDVLVALGQVDESLFGIECAGQVSRAGTKSGFKPGDRVCAVVDGSLRAYTRCDSRCAVVVPDNVTLEQAATLPISFTTAYYAIIHHGRTRSGESVLIHSGAGGLGQACIQLAKYIGAEIFATVGSQEKKEFLMRQYDIPEDHIYSNRTPEFVQNIKRVTKGSGIDVIVNTLSGEGLKNTWACIAPFGRFIEAKLKDIESHKNLPMEHFACGGSFAAVDLIYIRDHAKDTLELLLKEGMALMESGKIASPAPLQILPASEAESAFRLLQSGKSTGKIVIQFDKDDVVQAVSSSLPTYSFDPQATYLICGGLGGLGRNITEWMVSRGAKHLLLLSRSGAQDSSLAFIEDIKSRGVKLVVAACDISDLEGLGEVLNSYRNSMPPIRGCIQSAMVLKDSKLNDMTLDDFSAAIKPKVNGSWNLHTLLPRVLDFFIMLSSSNGIIGWHGQSNYASGNTYQDALARYLVTTKARRAISLDSGGFHSAGYVAGKTGLAKQLEAQGVRVSQESELHDILEYYCNPSLDIDDETQSQLITGIATPASLRTKDIDVPSWMYPPLFSQLFQIKAGNSASVTHSTSDEDFSTRIKDLNSATEVAAEICEAIRQKLAKTLAIDKNDIDASKPMHTYGLDSLIAVEIRSWMKRSLGCDLSVFEILGNASIEELGKGMVEKCELLGKKLVQGEK